MTPTSNLNSDTAYAVVAGFATRGGIAFGIKPKALWEALRGGWHKPHKPGAKQHHGEG